MRFVLSLLAFLFAASAFAAPADLTISFDAPTVGPDQEAIDRYVLKEQCATTPTVLVDGVSDGQVFPGLLQTGQTYSLCVTAVDISGRESAPSAIQTVTLADLQAPGAPQNFTIQVQCADCLVTIQGQ